MRKYQILPELSFTFPLTLTTMFGSTAAKPPATPFGGGGSTSLFGSSGQSSSAFGSSGGTSGSSLFGQSSGGFGSSGGSGGLFGQASGSASSGAAGSGGLFGQKSSTTGGGLFGSGSATSGGSLFGGGSGSSGGGLFGGASGGSGGGLFGQSSSAFGGGQSFGAPSGIGGGGLFGSAPSNTFGVSSLPASTVEYDGKTKVSQLPEHVQKDLLKVETHLREQRMKSAKLWADRIPMQQTLQQLQDRFTAFQRELVRNSAVLESFHANANLLRAAVQEETRSAADVKVATDNVINATQGGLGSIYGQSLTVTRVPGEYFLRIIDDMEARAYEYKKEVDGIAEYLKATSPQRLQAGTFASHPDAESAKTISKGRMIEDILKRQFEYFMVVANQIASLHESLRALKSSYLQILWQQGREGFDPFLQADRKEQAEKERQKAMTEFRTTELVTKQNNASATVPKLQLPSSSTKQLSIETKPQQQGTSSFGASASFGSFAPGQSSSTTKTDTGSANALFSTKQEPAKVTFGTSTSQPTTGASLFSSSSSGQSTSALLSQSKSTSTPGASAAKPPSFTAPPSEAKNENTTSSTLFGSGSSAKSLPTLDNLSKADDSAKTSFASIGGGKRSSSGDSVSLRGTRKGSSSSGGNKRNMRRRVS